MALRWAAVVGISVWTRRSAWTQHSAWVTDPELAGPVGDDHRVGQQAVMPDRTPQRALGGDPHRVGRDGARIEAQGGQMRLPGRGIGEDRAGWAASAARKGPASARVRM